nr:hypothetical protein [Tanacetum cinerariifolium]
LPPLFWKVDPVGDFGYLKPEGNSGAHGDGGCDLTADYSGCYHCGGNHRERECPIGNNRGGGSRCYNCGKGGHYARDCPTGNSRRGGVGSACYNCGECGHYARDYPTGNSRRSGGSGCYTCGGVDK